MKFFWIFLGTKKMYTIQFMEEVAIEGRFESKELLYKFVSRQSPGWLLDLAMRTYCEPLLNEYVYPLIRARGFTIL